MRLQMLEFEINSKRINFIGDPHLGKNFAGVPLHRRGEREESQFQQFSDELNSHHDVTIMVGDLFDTFTVSNSVLIRTMSIILEASSANPNKQFIFISGNHDVSRDREVASSFQVLNYYLDTLPNVSCWMQSGVLNIQSLSILLCPYSEFETAEEVVTRHSASGYYYNLAVGHWDNLPIAGPHNLVPIEALKKVTDIAVSGHIHVPYTITDENLTVYGTGSMQPYSHAEDPTNQVYTTQTVEQVLNNLAIDIDFYKDKCLRIVIEKGEELPTDINCLQLGVKVVSESEKEDLQVELGDFNFEQMFRDTFKENGVSDEITNDYYEQYREKAKDAD